MNLAVGEGDHLAKATNPAEFHLDDSQRGNSASETTQVVARVEVDDRFLRDSEGVFLDIGERVPTPSPGAFGNRARDNLHRPWINLGEFDVQSQLL